MRAMIWIWREEDLADIACIPIPDKWQKFVLDDKHCKANGITRPVQEFIRYSEMEGLIGGSTLRFAYRKRADVMYEYVCNNGEVSDDSENHDTASESDTSGSGW